MSLYDLEVTKSNGETQSMTEHKGKVLLVVNTASKCGFTPQFEGLQKLYNDFHEKGLDVLGFPSDQFMNQEFDDQDQILEFCQTNYGVTFPMYQKVDVKGENQSPLFEFLTNEKRGILGGEVKWNFTKFLIDRDGNVVKRYSPQTKPEKIKEDIEDII